MEPTVDGSAMMPRAMIEAIGALKAYAGVADAVPEYGAEKPMVPEEPTTLPEVSEGVVGHVVRPPSPLVVPPAMEEDVEEIECEES